MRDAENIRELVRISPDFIGMIFFPGSTRFVTEKPEVDFAAIKKVGVFVNATNAEIIGKVREYRLDLVQLHGEEPVEQVRQLREYGTELIKVFGVTGALPLEQMKPYVPFVRYFLFDTQTAKHGGSGQKFNWELLVDYDLEVPFFLSGGIDLEDVEEIQRLNFKNLYAIDINSRFERAPALKDINKIKSLKERL